MDPAAVSGRIDSFFYFPTTIPFNVTVLAPYSDFISHSLSPAQPAFAPANPQNGLPLPPNIAPEAIALLIQAIEATSDEKPQLPTDSFQCTCVLDAINYLQLKPECLSEFFRDTPLPHTIDHMIQFDMWNTLKLYTISGKIHVKDLVNEKVLRLALDSLKGENTSGNIEHVKWLLSFDQTHYTDVAFNVVLENLLEWGDYDTITQIIAEVKSVGVMKKKVAHRVAWMVFCSKIYDDEEDTFLPVIEQLFEQRQEEEEEWSIQQTTNNCFDWLVTGKNGLQYLQLLHRYRPLWVTKETYLAITELRNGTRSNTLNSEMVEVVAWLITHAGIQYDQGPLYTNKYNRSRLFLAAVLQRSDFVELLDVALAGRSPHHFTLYYYLKDLEEVRLNGHDVDERLQYLVSEKGGVSVAWVLRLVMEWFSKSIVESPTADIRRNVDVFEKCITYCLEKAGGDVTDIVKRVILRLGETAGNNSCNHVAKWWSFFKIAKVCFSRGGVDLSMRTNLTRKCMESFRKITAEKSYDELGAQQDYRAHVLVALCELMMASHAPDEVYVSSLVYNLRQKCDELKRIVKNYENRKNSTVIDDDGNERRRRRIPTIDQICKKWEETTCSNEYHTWPVWKTFGKKKRHRSPSV